MKLFGSEQVLPIRREKGTYEYKYEFVVPDSKIISSEIAKAVSNEMLKSLKRPLFGYTGA